mmetsp:Transcript_37825/g.82907  ORF Transcript_37825/g.82907 Transcript_37825/m.82907 type:complete len:92 (-) Transcript_37825:410-685(-)
MNATSFFSSSRRAKCLRHTLNGILVVANIHARNTGDLSYPSSQLFVASRHNEAPPLLGHLSNAIIGVAALAVAGDALKSRVLRQAQSDLVL